MNWDDGKEYEGDLIVTGNLKASTKQFPNHSVWVGRQFLLQLHGG